MLVDEQISGFTGRVFALLVTQEHANTARPISVSSFPERDKDFLSDELVTTR
jgi:hypothetical protein